MASELKDIVVLYFIMLVFTVCIGFSVGYFWLFLLFYHLSLLVITLVCHIGVELKWKDYDKELSRVEKEHGRHSPQYRAYVIGRLG